MGVTVRTIAVIPSLATFAPTLASAQEECTVQTLRGKYILAGRGYMEPGDPGVQRVHRGLLVFDGVGNVSGKQSSSRAGKIGHEKLQGTYTLDADCSGTMTFVVWTNKSPARPRIS